MRLFLILALAGTVSFANQISKYEGEVYSLTNVAICEYEVEKTIRKVEEHEGFRVIEGGCSMYGQQRVRAQFTYIHPMIRDIERFERSFKDNKSCLYHASTSKFSFENAQLQTVASFCDGEKLVVDYVDYNFQLVTRLNLPMKYSQEQQCRNSLNRIKDTLSKHDVNTLIATCEKSVTFPLKEIFTPTIDVSRHYSIEIKSILGKRLSRDETCSIDAASIKRALESVDIELGEAGCAEYGNHSYEYILYVKKSKTPFVQTFKGGVYSSESACQEQLEKAVDAIESMGKTTFYKYCTNSGASSVPVIYYAR